MSTLSNRIRETAKMYRRAGWNVIPLRNYEKSPASYNSVMPFYWERQGEIVELQPDKVDGWNKKQGWKPLQNRMATDAEFERMFASSDVTGLGAITGTVSDLYVLDEDSYKEGGQKVIRKSTCISKTANGGRHYFFKHDKSVDSKGLRNKVFIEGKGEGGFVVLPPSLVLKKDGKQKGDYRWVASGKIKDIPQITKADIAFIPEEEQRRLTEGGTIDFAELMEVGEGNRHNSMRELMTKKLNITKPDTWDDVVLNEIKMYNDGYQPPLKDFEMEKLWRDTKRFVLNNPPDWLRKHLAMKAGETPSEPVPDKIEKPRGLIELAQDRLKERALEKQAASTGYTELDFLVKGFIPGHLYTVTGETNIGKTAMCANFAVNVAQQGKNVLYISLEPDNMIMEYVASIIHKKEYDKLTEDDLVSAAEQDGHIHVYGQKEIPTTEHLIKAIETENQYQLIIVDHIGYFVKSQNNTYQDQSNVIKKLALLAKQKKLPVILIAHINKEASKRNKPLTYNDISGSAAFKQDSTDVWLLERGDKNKGLPKDEQRGWNDYTEEGYIKVAKSKSGKNGQIEVCFREGKALVEEPSDDIDELF